MINPYFPSQIQSLWHAHAPLASQADNPIFWHSKPDYVSLLSEKFGTDLGDDCAENAPDLNLAPQNLCDNSKLNNKDNVATAAAAEADDDDSDHDAENDLSECNLLESKARGRHQSQAASLRISKIEKILSSRTDLTK